ncbi:MAG TPA: hypothetical protein VMR41_04350 [Patescibacteria group bacterium]|nr:hypothetical protein [Patescibacteria group bacterium]
MKSFCIKLFFFSSLLFLGFLFFMPGSNNIAHAATYCYYQLNVPPNTTTLGKCVSKNLGNCGTGGTQIPDSSGNCGSTNNCCSFSGSQCRSVGGTCQSWATGSCANGTFLDMDCEVSGNTSSIGQDLCCIVPTPTPIQQTYNASDTFHKLYGTFCATENNTALNDGCPWNDPKYPGTGESIPLSYPGGCGSGQIACVNRNDLKNCNCGDSQKVCLYYKTSQGSIDTTPDLSACVTQLSYVTPTPPSANTMSAWGSIKCVDNGVATLDCIPAVFQILVNAALVLAGTTALLFIIWAGIRLIASNGDAKQAEAARKVLTFAILGLIIILLAAAVINLIADFTGVQCIKFFGFQQCR